MIIALQMLILLRESALALLNGWLPPFFTQLVRKLSDNHLVPVKEDIEEQVYADYDEKCGVVFFPLVYAQRYAAVCDCLMDKQWFGRLEKVLNIGKHYDINFMRYLTEVSGVTQILGLDIAHSLNCTCDILDLSFNDYDRWGKPLQITLLQGNAADPDYRLIGCDAVIAIEMIQNLLPHDLDRLVHNVFGFVKPWVAVFTTPNADFNCLLKNLDKNGLRQSDHYFEWTREQLHDWCSNIVTRYPEYMVKSRGVGPGPAGTSHYGCFSQLVLFMSKHYKKEMELSVNSLVMVSSLPEPEQVSEISWITPSVPSSHSVFHTLLETDSSELDYPYSSSGGTPPSSTESMRVQCMDRSVQCNIEVEFGKKFVMFNDDEMYQIRVPRKRCEGNVYEIGDVASSLNNTMYDVKQFSKTTQYLMEKHEYNGKDLMDEILQLTETLTCKVNLSSGDECHLWNNVNWGENVPYWNQYYKVVGVYNFPYEGRSEDDMILELISEKINKMFDEHAHGGSFGIPVEELMDTVKHITDDVERVIMLMEDSGYELDGESVVYTGVDVSEASHNEDLESNFDSDTVSNGSSSEQDFNGLLLNRKLYRKIKMLRLVLPQDDDIKQALGQVVCRLKKLARSLGPDKSGPARSKWLQSKFLELLTLTEKSILRKKLRSIENDPLKGLVYDTGDDTASHLYKIKAEDDTAIKIVEKYESMLQLAKDNLEDVRIERDSEKSFPSKFTDGSGNSPGGTGNNYKEFFEVPALETDNLSVSPNDELTRYTSDEQHIDGIQYWEEKDMSIYQEETNEPKNRKCWDLGRHPIHMKSYQESKVKSPKKKSKNSNSSISKKKSKHSASVIAVKKSIKNISSVKILDRKSYNARNDSDKVLNKFALEKTQNYIDKMRKKMGPTLVLSIPPKPIPGSILELCHPDLHQKTPEPYQNTNDSWVIDTPVAATEHTQMVEILSQSKTVTVALQRMIGTDPEVDAEIYEHELELSDLTSLMNETSYFSHTEKIPTKGSFYDLSGFFKPTQDFIEPQQANNPVVEIVTQDGRELIVLQRSIGTDPEIESEMCEFELKNSKLTTSLNNMASFEKIPADVVNVTSQEFFLYDLDEPTTSKGIRHVSMDVQCGTEGQISATTSFTCPLRMFGPLEFQDSLHTVRAILKNDCVTSTNDILKPCETMTSPWMKFVGIKIKDSNHEITDTYKETETVFGPFAIADNKSSINASRNNSMIIETTDANRLSSDDDTYDQAKKKMPNLRTKNIKSPTIYSRPKSNEISRIDSNRSTTRFLPKGVRSKLSCGGVHVHSFKNLQASEDVVYQGEWQRHRHCCNPKKYNQPSFEKFKFTRKTSSLPKPQRVIIQKKTSPIMIRNTKASKMKEAVTKMHMQKKLATTKQDEPRSRPVIRQASMVKSKLTASFTKPSKEKSNKLCQPPRHTRFAPRPTIIREKSAPTSQTRKVYIPPYLEKMKMKQQVSEKLSKIEAKRDHLTNMFNVNKEEVTSIQSQSKVDDLVSALLKVSVEPPKDISYVVYRNEMDVSNCSTAIENLTLPARSSKENILKCNLSNLSHNSTYSLTNSATIALNPVITTVNPFTRQTTPISSIRRKGSDSKIVSKIKKLANLIKKSNANEVDLKRFPENSSITSQKNSKSASNVDLLLDRTNNPSSSIISNESSSTKSFLESPDSNNGLIPNEDSIEDCIKQDSKTTLVLDGTESKSDTQESINSQILVTLLNESSVRDLEDPTEHTNKTITDDHNNIFDAMKQLVEECLNFKEPSKLLLNGVLKDTDLKSSDVDIITSNGSDTYETGSSFHCTYGARSLASLTQSFTNFSTKSQPSASKISENLAEDSWYPVAAPSVNGSKIQSENKDTISITQKPKTGLAFSSFSVNTQPSPLELSQQPDYVNLVDSETGSCSRANRRATSEEVLVSGRSSGSYVSCALDEDAAIPSWLYNVSQQASGSFSSSRHAIVPEGVPEQEYDVNGNELTVHGAGAGDGCGIHSDQSQDSSGQGTSFSSSASSRIHSESIVVDPGSFLAGYAPTGERPNSSAEVPAEAPIESLDVAPETQNRPANRNRIPRTAHRVSLPASDADISSIDTDVPSD